MSKIGFIGLGIMGRPMAGHLLDAGHELTTVKRGTLAAALAEKGMQELDSPDAVAQVSDVIITMVPDTPDVEEVLFGEQGVVHGLKPGTLVIDMSSIAPLATQEFARRIHEAGGEYVDAPVSGGEGGAINAALTIMVGATQ
ncbi:MAG: NAD(P)-dependent oxidoreductase, partial [Pseudomonadota bacterium]|nr:NAD(P)-dependent oxidoreductase [Pseudomonadota bacterium]